MILNMRSGKGPVHAAIHGRTFCGRLTYRGPWVGTSQPVTCRPCRMTAKRWIFRQGIVDGGFR